MKKRVTSSVTAPGDTNLSDAAEGDYSASETRTAKNKKKYKNKIAFQSKANHP